MFKQTLVHYCICSYVPFPQLLESRVQLTLLHISNSPEELLRLPGEVLLRETLYYTSK